MNLHFTQDVPLARHTTLKTGGVARYFVTVKTVEELGAAVASAEQKQLPHLILGGGSNLLVADAGFPGLVIKMEIMGRLYENDGEGSVRLIVGAGENLDDVVADAVAHGYAGLENLSAIPGTVGATPVQNVGAYGVEVKDVIEAVETYHVPTATAVLIANEECRFGYRDSFFKTTEGAKYVITAVHFRLMTKATVNITYRDLAQRFAHQSEPSLAEVRAAVIAIRAEKFPDWHTVGTAGSFFKNPIIPTADAEELRVRFPELPLYEASPGQMKVSLGYVLDKICGLKGYTEGKVGLYEKQALVLIAKRGATTDEVLHFAATIAAKVYAATGLTIEREVRYVS